MGPWAQAHGSSYHGCAAAGEKLEIPNSSVEVVRLADLKGLRTLNLDSSRAISKLTDPNLTLINLPNLESLSLDRTKVGDKTVQDCKAWRKLTTVNLHGTKITDDAFKAMAGWKKLEDLKVGGTAITGAGLASLNSR